MTSPEPPEDKNPSIIRERRAPVRGRHVAARRWVLVLAALVVLAAGVAWVRSLRRLMGAEPTGAVRSLTFEERWAARPRLDTGVPKSGAKVVVVLFNDWLCLPCESALAGYQPVLDKFQQTDPGAVRLVLKDFPWDPSCNPVVSVALRPGACEAAAAVRLARQNGKSQDLIDWLSANRGVATPESVRAAATTVGKIVDFNAKYLKLLPLIRQDAADGGALDVRATPSVFINGVRATDPDGGLFRPRDFERAIAYEITAAK